MNKLTYQEAEELVFSTLDWNKQNEYLNQQILLSQPLPQIKKIKLNCPTPENYHISSTSILNIDGGYKCNLRAINYIYTPEGNYISRDTDGIVRTKNYMVQLDHDFNIQQQQELIDHHEPIYPCHVMGQEDVRLFGDYYFCTRLDVNFSHTPKVCFYNGSLHILNYGNMGTEKNWLPCYDGDCKIIYKFNPLTIYNLNLETAEMTPFLTKHLGPYSTFRGSAVPILYKDGWLLTIHQVFLNKLRKYIHRFVWLSKDFNEIKISDSFYFEKIGVEFSLGIAHSDEGLIVCYSVDDNHSTLAIVDYDVLNKMLGF